MIRVGFLMMGAPADWLGGANYFRSLFGALLSVPERQLEPLVFVSRRHVREWRRQFAPEVRVIATSLIERWTPQWVLRKGLQVVARRDLAFEGLLRLHRVRLLSHAGVLGRGGAVRTLGWIPDLQHRDLPEFFGEAECRVRDGAFRMLCSDCDAVVVSSEHAREGLLEFVPSAASKLHVLRFVPQVPSVESLPTRRELAERYGVDGPYFHLPNQFWKHKNHTIVLDALAQLRRDGAPAVVVATGSKEDYRNPGHFDALMRRVRTEGLEADFRVLGVVPYADMLGLMCSAVAVINPSFFEGWSTTVEEAKRMGARVILSDIAVHREQAPNRGIFFAPRSADALATAMLETLRSRSELDRAGAEGAYVAFGEAYQRLVLGILGVRDGT